MISIFKPWWHLLSCFKDNFNIVHGLKNHAYFIVIMQIFLQYIVSRIKSTQLTLKYTAPRWLMPEMSGIIPVHDPVCTQTKNVLNII